MGVLLSSSEIWEGISKGYRKIREVVELKTSHVFGITKQLVKTGLK